MNSIICDQCHDGGYLDYNVYCDCSAGVFYEERDEHNLQRSYDELDIEYESDDYEWFFEYTASYLFSALPFYEEY